MCLCNKTLLPYFLTVSCFFFHTCHAVIARLNGSLLSWDHKNVLFFPVCGDLGHFVLLECNFLATKLRSTLIFRGLAGRRKSCSCCQKLHGGMVPKMSWNRSEYIWMNRTSTSFPGAAGWVVWSSALNWLKQRPGQNRRSYNFGAVHLAIFVSVSGCT